MKKSLLPLFLFFIIPSFSFGMEKKVSFGKVKKYNNISLRKYKEIVKEFITLYFQEILRDPCLWNQKDINELAIQVVKSDSIIYLNKYIENLIKKSYTNAVFCKCKEFLNQIGNPYLHVIPYKLLYDNDILKKNYDEFVCFMINKYQIVKKEIEVFLLFDHGFYTGVEMIDLSDTIESNFGKKYVANFIKEIFKERLICDFDNKKIQIDSSDVSKIILDFDDKYVFLVS